MSRTVRRRTPPVVATCGCGERIQAKDLDTVNARLVKHYRTCNGKKKRK